MSNVVTPPVAPSDLVELGRVAAAYGVKGWIKIQPYSADAEVLISTASVKASAPAEEASPVAIWWLARPALPNASIPAAPRAFHVRAARAHGSSVVAQLAGVDDRDQAEALRGMAVSVPRSLFPPPQEEEFYWVDLLGCTVFGQDGEGAAALLGIVGEVLDNGAHALLKVLRQDAAAPASDPTPVLDAKGRQVEVLVPFVQAHIQGVDLATRRIDSDWPLHF